jgi:hypothetical protein
MKYRTWGKIDVSTSKRENVFKTMGVLEHTGPSLLFTFIYWLMTCIVCGTVFYLLTRWEV